MWGAVSEVVPFPRVRCLSDIVSQVNSRYAHIHTVGTLTRVRFGDQRTNQCWVTGPLESDDAEDFSFDWVDECYRIKEIQELWDVAIYDQRSGGEVLK